MRNTEYNGKHSPRYLYDCVRCKYSWCCGYICACALPLTGKKYKLPPEEIRNAVDKERTLKGLIPNSKEWTKNERNCLS